LYISKTQYNICSSREFIAAVKHIFTIHKVEEENPEDCIPDLPENEQAREFLSKAPKKGLWMPLGKEVKVMKCKTA
jgi:hypothetical protein